MMTLALARMDGAYPVVLGLSGAQGSGKSTLSALLQFGLERIAGKRVAVLSLDDFYLPRTDRQALAHDVHPLCATRGVPGTHDMALMLEVLSRLLAAQDGTDTRWPLFDKLSDDRATEDHWWTFTGRPDLIVIEGWCVGLPANRLPPWAGPINALESECDPNGVWHAWSRRQLQNHYTVLWKALDLLVGVRLPDMATVVASRLLQEQRMQAAQDGHRAGMDEAAVWRFVEHYERMTLALWDALPDLADLLSERDAGFDYRAVPCRTVSTP